MSGTNVSLNRVTENQATGAVTFWFSNGQNPEYTTWDDVEAVANTVDAADQYAQDILVAKTFRTSPDGSNKQNQIGASVSVNANANFPVVYTPPA